MIDIERDRWTLASMYGGDEFSASFACPKCKQMAALDHKIDNSGNVTPSVSCPYKCDFHDWIRLLGWAKATGQKETVN
jgi:hypothetical protein